MKYRSFTSFFFLNQSVGVQKFDKTWKKSCCLRAGVASAVPPGFV